MSTVYTFDKENHRHFINGIQVPGVTGILKAEGFIDTKWSNEYALYRGSYVHLACHHYNIGVLDYEALLPEFKGYIDAWIAFCNEWKIPCGKEELSEVPLYSTAWKFAGIADRITKDLFDIKTSKEKQEWWKYQSAGYKFMHKEMTGITLEGRYSVQLAVEGTFKVDEHTGKNDEREFLQILSVHQLKIRDGLLNAEGDVQL